MIDQVKQFQVLEVEVPDVFDLMLLLVLDAELECVHGCSKPRMAQCILVLLFVVFLGERHCDYLRVFDVENGLQRDEAVRVFGFEAEQIEERHGRVEHLHVLLLEQILPDLEGVFFLHLRVSEDAPAGENRSAGDKSSEEHFLEYACVEHN